jgi:hypothetical protein
MTPRFVVLVVKRCIRKSIYVLGPGLRFARRVGALDEADIPSIEFMQALAEVLHDLECRHARN